VSGKGLIVECLELIFEQENVIAFHARNTQSMKSQSSGDVDRLLRSRPRIRRAHIADHANSVSAACRQDSTHAFGKKRIVSGAGIVALAQLTQRDRSLGQALEHKEVELALFGQFNRGLNAIAGESRSRADSDLLHLRSPQQTTLPDFA
jgi:hypothetical protein